MDPEDYTIGWICVIREEYVAAQVFLDEKHDAPVSVSKNDNNDYTLGQIGQHKVVIAVLPDGEYGSSSAAMVARDMMHSFPNVRFGLLVGIGSAAPSERHDIRLGDVVVSTPHDGNGGVLQYDFDQTILDQRFRQTEFLDQPPTVLRTAVSGLRAKYEADGHCIDDSIHEILSMKPRLRKKYKRPLSSCDRLYESVIIHPPHNGSTSKASCAADCAASCGNPGSSLITRRERIEEEDNPAIHYGLIASGSRAVKDARVRDKLAIEKDVLCFEIGASGLMNHFPCLVVRGMCDYADSHANTEWHGYSAMAAAAYAKDLLYRMHPKKVQDEKRVSELLYGVLNAVTQAEHSINMLKSEFDTRENLEVFNWLTPIEYGPQHSDYLKRRASGTGRWLLSSREYQIWLNSSKQTLFCSGIPGSGKTILAAIIVDDLTIRFSHDPAIGLAYIYCNFRQRDSLTIENLLASLLKQLGRKQSLIQEVHDLYDKHKRQQTRPTVKDIMEALRFCLSKYSKVFFVIDALDECPISNGCLSELLSHIFSLQATAEINFLATSRPIPEIAAKFIGCPRREILATNEDVREYLDAHISDLPRFILKRPDIQEEIKTDITSAVEGMFLLAQLYLDSLKDKTSVREINAALLQLKKQSQNEQSDMKRVKILEKAYEQAMIRIDNQLPGFRQLGRKVLLWITCAARQLTTSELQCALAIEIGDTGLNEDNLREVDDIISVCAGLVTADEKNDIVRLVHYTAQEYFERTQSIWFPDAAKDITRICATYLSFSVFESGFCESGYEFQERLRVNRLYDYATQYWGHHARNSLTLCEEVIKFLEDEEKVLGASQGLMVGNSHYRHALSLYSEKGQQHVTGLHLAAYFGVAEAVRIVLQRKVEIGAMNSNLQTPLMLAVGNGHDATVKLLLQNGPSLIVKDKTNAMSEAKNRADAGLEAQDKNSASSEPKDKNGQTPLSLAAKKGHETVVRLLIEEGSDLESREHIWEMTPLSIATWYGHEAVVRLLCEAGANIESKDWSDDTPLLRATYKGHIEIMKVLLEAGADIESRGLEGRALRSPLWLAAQRGQEMIVKLLLERGANIESRDDRDGQTPLSIAAANGNSLVVDLLLERSADLETKDNEGRTPLWLAAWSGYESAVIMLVERGADLESIDDREGQSPLSIAAANGYNAVFHLLLEKGADLTSKDREGWTSLRWATQNGHEEIVETILKR